MVIVSISANPYDLAKSLLHSKVFRMLQDLNPSEFGQLLKAARHDTGMKAREAADKAGINRSQWSQYENGKRAPTLESFRRICHALTKANPTQLLQLQRSLQPRETT